MKLPRYVTFIIFITFGLIVLLPITFMFVSAFSGDGPISTDFFKLVFLSARQWLLLKNSLFLSSGVTLLSLGLGIFLALLLERTNLWRRHVFNAIYLIPLLIPPYIHAIIWTQFLAKNSLIGQNKWIISPLFKIHSLTGAIFVLTLAFFPFITLMTISGLKSVDQHLEEASLIHHGPLRTLKSITLPLVTPHIFSGAIFVFIFTLVNFSVPNLLRVNVYPVEIFIQFSAFFNHKAATFLSLPLILIAISLIVLQSIYMKNRSYLNLGGAKGKRDWVKLSPIMNALFLLSCLIIFSLSILLPMIVLFKTAGPFSNYVKSFSSSKNQIGYSLVLAFIGAAVCIMLSFFISYSIERRLDWKKRPMEFMAFLPLAIPAIVLGIGMIKVWNHPWTNVIYGSSVIVIFGYIARFLPFGVWTIQSNLKQIPIHLEEAGTLNISSWSKIFKEIVMPLCEPGLMAGFFIIFVLCLGELATTLLIIPPGKSTLPIKIYNLLHYGAEHRVAALSLILIALIIIFSGVFLTLYRLLSIKEQYKAG